MKLVTGMAEIEDEAAQWLARLDSGEASDSEQHAFRRWLDADGRHKAAVESIDTAWGSFDTLTALPAEQKERLLGASDRAAARSSSPVVRRFAAAAALVAIAVLGAWQLRPQPPGTLYSTSVGERRAFPLGDGSTITLNTGSRVRVYLTSAERLVSLERGQAFFEVAHDTQRPFKVRIGDRQVRAVGTAFDIRRVGDDFVVVVTEGTVEVTGSKGRQADAKTLRTAEHTSQLPQPLRLTHGEKLAVRGPLAAARISPLESLQKETAWQSGLLEFNGETLAQVVEEFGRYTNRHIIIPDDHIKQMRVGGIFVVGDVDALASALDAMLPVKVLTVTPYVTVLLSDPD